MDKLASRFARYLLQLHVVASFAGFTHCTKCAYSFNVSADKMDAICNHRNQSAEEQNDDHNNNVRWTADQYGRNEVLMRQLLITTNKLLSQQAVMKEFSTTQKMVKELKGEMRKQEEKQLWLQVSRMTMFYYHSVPRNPTKTGTVYQDST